MWTVWFFEGACVKGDHMGCGPCLRCRSQQWNLLWRTWWQRERVKEKVGCLSGKRRRWLASGPRFHLWRSPGSCCGVSPTLKGWDPTWWEKWSTRAPLPKWWRGYTLARGKRSVLSRWFELHWGHMNWLWLERCHTGETGFWLHSYTIIIPTYTWSRQWPVIIFVIFSAISRYAWLIFDYCVNRFHVCSKCVWSRTKLNAQICQILEQHVCVALNMGTWLRNVYFHIFDMWLWTVYMCVQAVQATHLMVCVSNFLLTPAHVYMTWLPKQWPSSSLRGCWTLLTLVTRCRYKTYGGAAWKKNTVNGLISNLRQMVICISWIILSKDDL